MSKGLFIVFEGIDGCGKSTQAERLAKFFGNMTGKEVVRTAEPYILRDLILGRKDLSVLAELLLFLADRAEHVNKIIMPALEAGQNIICERYNASTLAYQSGGHEIKIPQVKNLIEACNFPEPDLQIFLDVKPETAFERVKARNNKNDKFEDEGLNLIKKVSEFYKTLPDLIKIPCDNLNEDEVFKRVLATVLGNGGYFN